MKLAYALILALAAALAPASGHAQTGPLIIDQNRPDRAAPTASPAPTPPRGAGRVEAAPAASTPFLLQQVDVQGSTLPAADLQAAYAPFIGRTVTADDLSALADAIGSAYAKSGIALYTVLLPRQAFTDGRVRVRVVEGYISDIEVQAADAGQKGGLVQSYADRLRRQRPLRREALDRYIALMRDIPGGKVDAQFAQDGAPGAVKLIVRPQQRRFEGGLSVNNRGAAYLGRTQVQLQATAYSLARHGDRTTLTLMAPTDTERFQYAALSHGQPIGATGATFTLSAGHLRTKPKIVGLELTGAATTAGAQVTYPWIRSSSHNLYLTAGLDGLDSDNALFGRRFSSERTRTLRLAGAYSRLGATRAASASLAFSQGVDGLGARIANTGYAEADYYKFNASAGLSQAIGQRWAVRLSAGAQFGGDRLPASEQFSIGGPQYGRAFPASEATGDSGYGASAELAYRPASGLPRLLAGSEAYGFADGAVAVAKARAGFPGRRMDLASAGGGVRLAFAAKGVLELEAVKAIDEVGAGAKERPWQLMLNLRSTF